MQHPNYSRDVVRIWQAGGGFLRHKRHEERIVGFSEEYREESYKKALFMDCLNLSFCPKFILPEGGYLFREGFKALSNIGAKLPYKEGFALEFLAVYKSPYTGDRITEKNIVLTRYMSPANEDICMSGFVNNSYTKAWVYIPPISIPEVDDKGLKNPRFEDDGVDTFLRPTIISEDLELGYCEMFTQVLWYFLNALACKNVHIEKSLAKATKQGKKIKTALPFDDYHFLTVNTPGKVGVKGECLGGTHRSPREHLRRGHIRLRESGPVWVNACVVNPGIGSKVEKTYVLRRSETEEE